MHLAQRSDTDAGSMARRRAARVLGRWSRDGRFPAAWVLSRLLDRYGYEQAALPRAGRRVDGVRRRGAVGESPFPADQVKRGAK